MIVPVDKKTVVGLSEVTNISSKNSLQVHNFVMDSLFNRRTFLVL